MKYTGPDPPAGPDPEPGREPDHDILASLDRARAALDRMAGSGNDLAAVFDAARAGAAGLADLARIPGKFPGLDRPAPPAPTPADPRPGPTDPAGGFPPGPWPSGAERPHAPPPTPADSRGGRPPSPPAGPGGRLPDPDRWGEQVGRRIADAVRDALNEHMSRAVRDVDEHGQYRPGSAAERDRQHREGHGGQPPRPKPSKWLGRLLGGGRRGQARARVVRTAAGKFGRKLAGTKFGRRANAAKAKIDQLADLLRGQQRAGHTPPAGRPPVAQPVAPAGGGGIFQNAAHPINVPGQPAQPPVARPVGPPVGGGRLPPPPPGIGGGAGAVGAGEGAAAGRAAGAAVMAGEGLAAAAGPLALVAAAAIGVGEAFVQVGKAGLKLAKEQEEAARRNQVSPELVGINQQLDARRMTRQMESGANTAGSYQELVDSINRLEQTTQPIKDAVSNIKNVVAADILQGISDLIEAVKQIPGVQKALELAKELNKDKVAEGDGFGNMFAQIDAERERQRQAAQQRLAAAKQVNQGR